MAIISSSGISKKSYRDLEYEIFEVGPGDNDFLLPDGSKLKSPYIHFRDETIKTYMVSKNIEAVNGKDEIISVDFVYGKMDLDRLSSDSAYREMFLKYILSREVLDNIVKNFCGALPEEFVMPINPEKEWFKNKSYFKFDSRTVMAVAEGVLRGSYRKKTKVESVEDPEPFQMPKGFWNAFHTIEGSDVPKKKKKSILQVFQEIDEKNAKEIKEREEKQDRERRRARGEVVEEPLDYAEEADWDKIKADDSIVVFYKTGLVIIQKPMYNPDGTRTGTFKTNIVSRYSLGYKDMSNTRPAEIQTILISDVDEEKLGLKGEYREKFISDICLPILQYAKYGLPVEITQKWPYVGSFSADDSLSLKKNSNDEKEDLQKYFSILSGKKKRA